MDLRRRGGRKVVVVPGDGAAEQAKQRVAAVAERPLVKLLARAFYWKRLFVSGEYASLEELAAAENVDKSYLSKVLRLTLLAPNIVEAILEGLEPPELTIERLILPLPIEWETQYETMRQQSPAQVRVSEPQAPRPHGTRRSSRI